MSIVKTLRDKRTLSRQSLVHHPIASIQAFSEDPPLIALVAAGVSLYVIAYVIVGIIGDVFFKITPQTLHTHQQVTYTIALLIVWLKPEWKIVLQAGLEKRWPRKQDFLAPFTPKERITTYVLTAIMLVMAAIANTTLMWIWLILLGLISVSASWIKRHWKHQEAQTDHPIVNPVIPSYDPKAPFQLWLGQSTGLLAQHGHPTSLKPDQHVGLTLTEAGQNLLVLGGIGTGKTTRVIHPLLVQLLDQHCGGLIFDIKGDFYTAVQHAAKLTDRPYRIIGPGFTTMNLLEGLTPTLAASMLKSGLLLSGTHSDPFWIDTATELCRHALGCLVHVPEHYTLKGLYDYVFVEAFNAHVQEVLGSLYPALPEKERRALLSHQRYATEVFERFDEKVKAGVRATCAQLLAPFSQIELMDAFCEANSEQLPWASILDGQVFFVNLPLAQWGLGAKLAYTFLKLRFFNLMQQRALHPEWNQDTPVFFLCDEYQEIVSACKDGLSDLSFWDKSRSSKTIGIVSSQSIASFYAAIGDRDQAQAILQNFRQRLCFRTEDELTLKHFQGLAGEADIQHLSYAKANQHSGLLNAETSTTFTTTVTTQRHSVIQPQLFRTLKEGQVIALLNLANGFSADDILMTEPVYF